MTGYGGEVATIFYKKSSVPIHPPRGFLLIGETLFWVIARAIVEKEVVSVALELGVYCGDQWFLDWLMALVALFYHWPFLALVSKQSEKCFDNLGCVAKSQHTVRNPNFQLRSSPTTYLLFSVPLTFCCGKTSWNRQCRHSRPIYEFLQRNATKASICLEGPSVYIQFSLSRRFLSNNGTQPFFSPQILVQSQAICVHDSSICSTCSIEKKIMAIWRSFSGPETSTTTEKPA